MKEKLKKVKEFFASVNPITWGAIVLGLFLFLPGDSSIYSLISYYNQLNELEGEKKELQQKLDGNKKKLDELQFDDSELERHAREVYLMKSPDEDVYILNRKDINSQIKY